MHVAIIDAPGAQTEPNSAKSPTLACRRIGNDGGKIIQSTADGASKQRWRISQVSPGKYKFVNVNSGKNMEVSKCSLADGATLVQSTYGPAVDNHLWSFTPTGDGFYKFNPASRQDASLQAASRSTSDGALIQQWSWNRAQDQQWQVSPVNP